MTNTNAVHADHSMKLVILSARTAKEIGMAASAAGGWIAVDMECRMAVGGAGWDLGYGYGWDEALVALVPEDWQLACVTPTSAQVDGILVHLDRQGGPAADIAGRIRDHQASA